MPTENPLGVEIARIRARLRAMRTEREAAMSQLAESREAAETHRHIRVDAELARRRSAPPDAPDRYAQ